MSHNIISALYPSYFSQLLVGCGPIKVSKTRQSLKTTHRRIYDYSIRLILILIVTFIYYRYSLLNFDDFKKNGLVKFMTTSYFVIVGGLISINVINSRLQKRSMVKLWYKIDEVDARFTNMGIKIPYGVIKRSSTKFLVVGFSCFTIYFIYTLTTQKFVSRIQPCVTYGLLYLAILNYVSFTCSFLTIIRVIAQMTEKLLKALEDSLIYKPFSQKLVLVETMKLYHELYELLQMTTKIFAAQILWSFTVSFVIITFQSYSIFCAVYIKSPYLNHSLASLIWIVVFVIEKMELTFSCHKCMFRSIEFRQKLGKYVATHSKNKMLVRELNAFGLQLLHERFEIYAGNMFLIDLPIFTSVCGTATTYIILLWQSDSKVDLIYSMKKVFGASLH